jgi:hypothetical protein
MTDEFGGKITGTERFELDLGLTPASTGSK